MSPQPIKPAPESYLARLGVLFPTPSPNEQSTDAALVADEEVPASPSGNTWPARLRQFTAQHVKVVSALVLGMVIVTTWMVMRARTVPLDTAVDTSASPTWTTVTPSPSVTPSAPQWLVHVVGAVASPGVVAVPEGARVIDVIDAAGGLTADADPADLNLAAVVADGCQVLIGTQAAPRGEVRQGTDGQASTSSNAATGASPSAQINLNQATVEQLDTLPGVGPVTAGAIVTWRENNGSFASVEQLQEVDGIGPKTFAQIEPYVCV